MGHLKQGEWYNDKVVTSNDEGEFDREKSTFRDSISEGASKYTPDPNRYHLYVSYACPWAHRTLITRHLKGLEDQISVSVVHPDMLENSWEFRTDFDGATGDALYSQNYLYEIYQRHDPKVTTKVTVPVLWDKRSESIVNNESSEIIRILNCNFNNLSKNSIDLYPESLRSEIDQVNEQTYEPINNGVYKTGFATNQKAYEKAFQELFSALNGIDERLGNEGNYLVGGQLTEADIRLVTTLIRFDLVYYIHFKCNERKISEFKNLSQYLERMMALPAVKETTFPDHIKRHYYYSHDFLNPNRIVPVGPHPSTTSL